jgi:hypothetical protein
MKIKNKLSNKLSVQKERRQHLKSRRVQPTLERNKPFLEEKQTILIVCEGENTEPSYFKQFRLSSATIVPIGEGYHTVSLVERTIELAQKNEYDQIWCVFDKDDFDDFNNAITIAEKKGFHVAYSNQAFEYWILLHLLDHQGGGMHRKNYSKKINELLKPFKMVYDEKRKIITSDIFEILESIDEKSEKMRRVIAIERAKRNYNKFDHTNPARKESSTTVFRLVEEIIKFL